MSDRIAGICILDRSGPVHWLYHVQYHVDPPCAGMWGCDRLPVKPENTPDPGPPQRYYACYWNYSVRGDVITVHPSVKIEGFFHNEGLWSVRFIESPFPGDQEKNEAELKRLNPSDGTAPADAPQPQAPMVSALAPRAPDGRDPRRIGGWGS